MTRRAVLLLFTLASACAQQPRVMPAFAPDELARLDAAVATIRNEVPVDTYQAATFTHDGITLQYRLLSPPNVVAGRRYPMLVVFHGAGAIGTDNTAQIGPLAKSWATPEMRERHPLYVLIPQFSTRSAEYANGFSTATPPLHAALALVEQKQNELPVDPSRTYALGYSMGGSAVWNALALKPGLFTRAISVAGVPNRDALSRLGDTRFLLVHGDADTENPYAAARAAYDATDKRRVTFWQYRGLGHDFPPDLIATPRLAEWLFR
jgi:predicted peptidase